MIGFTVVLNKRKRRRIYREKSKRKPWLLFCVPIVFIIVFSLVMGIVFPAEKETEVPEADDISVFKEIDDYSAFYSTVVVNKFFSYKKGEQIDSEKLVSLSVWSLLLNRQTKNYQTLDGEIVLPEKEVRERVSLLFSEKINFENTSSGEIRYDEEMKAYIIPTMGFSPEYAGVLESVSVKGGKTYLHVACLESESFKQDSLGKTVFPEAEKNIVITLAKDKKSYYIEGIEEE